MAKSVIFDMVAAAIFDFADINFARKTSVPVSNLVRIRSKINYVMH